MYRRSTVVIGSEREQKDPTRNDGNPLVDRLWAVRLVRRVNWTWLIVVVSVMPLCIHFKVYMELGSYFLFLQEQIKDIIIIITSP